MAKPVVQHFLRRASFPEVVTVRQEPTRAANRTLEEQCLHSGHAVVAGLTERRDVS
jgi:hypothetical protein